MRRTRFDFKITLEFRHQPIFNSIHFTIYTLLPNFALFEKNPLTGYMCKNKGNCVAIPLKAILKGHSILQMFLDADGPELDGDRRPSRVRPSRATVRRANLQPSELLSKLSSQIDAIEEHLTDTNEARAALESLRLTLLQYKNSNS